MYVCVYICIYVCMYICVCMCVCMSVCMCVYVCMYVCMYIFVPTQSDLLLNMINFNQSQRSGKGNKGKERPLAYTLSGWDLNPEPLSLEESALLIELLTPGGFWYIALITVLLNLPKSSDFQEKVIALVGQLTLYLCLPLLLGRYQLILHLLYLLKFTAHKLVSQNQYATVCLNLTFSQGGQHQNKQVLGQS